MFFWHIGATIGFIRYAFRDPSMDLRYLALGAVLPNLIDLPIGIAMWGEWQTVRLASHSILFGALAMVLVLVFTRRGPVRKQWMLVAVGVMLHLVLDAMWREPETLWWPFFGWGFAPSGYATFGEYLQALFTDPVMWAGEVAGLVYLAMLWRAAGLGEPDARSRLLRTGVVSAPIDRR